MYNPNAYLARAAAPIRPIIESAKHQKRTQEEIDHVRKIKQKVDEALAKDLHKIGNPNYEIFKSKKEVLDSLLPYHIFQLPEIDDPVKIDYENIIEDVKALLNRGEKILEQNDACEKQIMGWFATSLCDPSKR